MKIETKKYLIPLFIVILFSSSFIYFIFTITDITTAANKSEFKDSYPLVVYGGEPEGVMAAVAAARQNREDPVLLVMNRKKPGGLMTYGGLNYLDLNYNSEGEMINQGLFAEWYKKMGESIAFPIDKATRVFSNMIKAEKNITLMRNGQLKAVKCKNGNLNSITVEYKGVARKIQANKFIDATQNADLAVKAGADFFVGGADRGLPDHHMAVTLVLHMGNINWEDLEVDAKQNTFGTSYINQDHAWGFVKIGDLYQPQNKNIKLRGLNIVRARDSEVYINGMLIFNVDPTDKKSLNQAYLSGKEEAKNVIEFLQKNVRGFENARLLDFPEELYVRESRHIVAEHQLTTDDQFSSRIFTDTIALGGYPLDYQASVPEYNGFVLFNPDVYGIPFRSLIPKGYSNLLVVGRSSGYSSLAAASSRVLPTGMAAGEAAGTAAVLANKADIDFANFIKEKTLINSLQEILFPDKRIKQDKNSLIKDSRLNPHLKNLLSWGLVIGGYNNNFKLDIPMKEKEFAHILIKGLQRRKSPILYEWVPGSLETLSKKDKDLTLNRAAMLLLAATSHRVLEMKSKYYFETALKEGVLPKSNHNLYKNNVAEKQNKTDKNRILSHREAYIIIARFLGQYPLPNYLRKLRGVE